MTFCFPQVQKDLIKMIEKKLDGPQAINPGRGRICGRRKKSRGMTTASSTARRADAVCRMQPCELAFRRGV